jgi:predicted nuclease of restriction endonuclease-like (RecB) superfamily
MSDLLPKDYPTFLQGLKERIRTAQTRAALAVSQELLRLYWQIGRDLEAAVRQGHWGEKVIERVAADLRREFPGMEGFSKRNLERMRAFYLAYPDEGQFAAQPVSQLPWGHNLVLLQKLKNPAERLWYAAQALQNGWSRAILEAQIETALYQRQGAALLKRRSSW